MPQYVRAIPEKCTGCRICENFCSFFHERAIWPSRTRIRVKSEFDEGPFFPTVCRQCEDAPCADACPEQIITQNNLTGAWTIDQEECTGCQMCIDACPYDEIFFDPASFTSLKCDLCNGNPECILVCPTGALFIVTEE
jgi:carbon-monoxide dehydrogenase iron sulfur subunit